MISIKKYTSKNLNVWNSFINSSNNGTVFQNQTFLNYHIKRKFKNHSLIIKKNNIIIALLPAVVVNKNNKINLFSHPGASYGGLIYKEGISFELINDIIIAVDQYCYSKRFHSIVLINQPNIYLKKYNEEEHYLLSFNNFVVDERYITHVVDLRVKNNLINLLSKRKKRYINSKSFNDFSFKPSNNFDAFYSILLKSKYTYKTKPTHSLQELKKIKKLFPLSCELLLSYYKKRVVGGSFLIFVNERVCLVFYNVIEKKHRDSQLSTYQLYQCMSFAFKRGSFLIDFGVSQTPETTNPLNPKMSLIKFKEQFGAFGVMRRVYKKIFYYDK